MNQDTAMFGYDTTLILALTPYRLELHDKLILKKLHYLSSAYEESNLIQLF